MNSRKQPRNEEPQDSTKPEDSPQESASYQMGDSLILAQYEDMMEKKKKASSSPPDTSTPNRSKQKPFHQIWSEI